jgi:hypothetical protein
LRFRGEALRVSSVEDYGPDMNRLLALCGEHEAELGYVCRPNKPTSGVAIRVFEDRPGFIRIDAIGEEGGVVQIVIEETRLLRRLADPQPRPPSVGDDGRRSIYMDLEV